MYRREEVKGRRVREENLQGRRPFQMLPCGLLFLRTGRALLFAKQSVAIGADTNWAEYAKWMNLAFETAASKSARQTLGDIG